MGSYSGGQKSGLIFEDDVFIAQEQSVLVS